VAIASAAKPGEAGRHQTGVLTMPAENIDLLHRGKRIVDLDVKTQPQALLELASKADVLLDCFRPGTCERLGIGPDDCAAVNPRLRRRGARPTRYRFLSEDVRDFYDALR
jgi:alpha-methylacyl-CoA racemase